MSARPWKRARLLIGEWKTSSGAHAAARAAGSSASTAIQYSERVVVEVMPARAPVPAGEHRPQPDEDHERSEGDVDEHRDHPACGELARRSVDEVAKRAGDEK